MSADTLEVVAHAHRKAESKHRTESRKLKDVLHVKP